MNKNVVRTIGNVTFLSLQQLWRSIEGIELEQRIRELMINAGVKFHDKERRFIAEPSVGIAGIGGLPVNWSDSTPLDAVELGTSRASYTPTSLMQDLQSMMGYGGFYSYLNPNDVNPVSLCERMHVLDHYSTAHTVTLNIAISGVSVAVENEFNSQRDLVHFCRLTEARTQVQNRPPVVVLYPEFLQTYEAIYNLVSSQLSATKRDPERSTHDFLEARNMAYPASKGTLFLVTGTLRNFQKIASTLGDSGKEDEYKRVVAKINDQLHELLPTLFKPTAEYGYSYPAHFG